MTPERLSWAEEQACLALGRARKQGHNSLLLAASKLETTAQPLSLCALASGYYMQGKAGKPGPCTCRNHMLFWELGILQQQCVALLTPGAVRGRKGLLRVGQPCFHFERTLWNGKHPITTSFGYYTVIGSDLMMKVVADAGLWGQAACARLRPLFC